MDTALKVIIRENRCNCLRVVAFIRKQSNGTEDRENLPSKSYFRNTNEFRILTGYGEGALLSRSDV